MDRNHLIASGLIVLVVMTLFLSGCSSSETASNTTAQTQITGTATTAAPSGPQYKAGDILKNPKSSSTTGILIVNYDAGTDMYERAFVYPNSDGSWYRSDTKTEKVIRSTIEKVYTQKVANRAVGSITIGTPVVTATAVPVTTTSVSTTATTATTTTTAYAAPKVTDISPDSGYTGTSVSITELKGYNFLTGATVQLAKSGSQNITATGVSVGSASLITCTIAIPSNATVGTWDVVVTNTNGYSGKYANGFVVRENTATTTTTTTSAAAPTVTGISPSTSQSQTYKAYTVSGTNFVVGATVRLTSSSHGTIVSSADGESTSTSIIRFFNIPENSGGAWDVVVTNPDGTQATLAGGLTISG